jgi:bifunctional non-homologous end joining protein LigD
LRCAAEVTLGSCRDQKDLGKKFKKIRDAIAALDIQDAIIDGEIVALDDKGRPSFQLLQGFDMGVVRPPIVFYAFDLLQLNGKDLRGLPIEERKAKLAALLKRPPTDIRYSPSFTQNIDELLSRVCELSLEGLIGKRAGSKSPDSVKTHTLFVTFLEFPFLASTKRQSESTSFRGVSFLATIFCISCFGA